jgi:hypothetical protein
MDVFLVQSTQVVSPTFIPGLVSKITAQNLPDIILIEVWSKFVNLSIGVKLLDRLYRRPERGTLYPELDCPGIYLFIINWL